MDKNFEKALSFVLQMEGGYSNNKYDKGGKTNFGITQTTYNSFRTKKGLSVKPIKNITKEEASTIYYENYWLASSANKIANFALAVVLFDSCVNHGVSSGLSLYKQSGSDVNKFLDLRREKYKRIVKLNPSQKIFLNGWLNRISKLEKFIKENSNS